MGNPRSCHVSILSDQAALGLLCLVNHGHWEMHKPFLTQDQSAEAETPVCLQRMKICFLGEVKERCALKQNIGRILLSAGTEEAPDTKWSSWGEGPSGAHPRGGLQCELSGRPEGPWDRSSAQPRRGQTRGTGTHPSSSPRHIQGLRQKDPREITGASCVREDTGCGQSLRHSETFREEPLGPACQMPSNSGPALSAQVSIGWFPKRGSPPNS